MARKRHLWSISAIVMLAFVLPALTQPAAAEGLRVASWNIYWLGDNGNNQRTERDYADLRDVARTLDASVVALQEVGSAEYAAKVFPADAYVIEMSNRTSAGQRTGFAIRKGVAYTRRADVETLNVTGNLRNGTVIDLHLAGGTLRMMAVHLKSGCFDGDLEQPAGDACTKLSRQVPALEAWVDENSAAGVAVMVLGDFNRRMDKAGDDLWRDLADGDPVELRRLSAGIKPKCYGGKFKEFIDHIVVNPPAEALVAPGSFQEVTYGTRPYADHKRLSDHCPISVDLRDGPSLQGRVPGAEQLAPMASRGNVCCRTFSGSSFKYWWTSKSSCKDVGGTEVPRSERDCK